MAEPQYLVVPVDGRPVCYDQVLDLAEIAGIQVSLPPREMLGTLKNPAPHQQLLSWWQHHLAEHPKATPILSLDTLAYGGLIASRVNVEPIEALQERTRSYINLLQPTHRPCYAFTSILRIPNYNNAEEEPEYWVQYGAMLYQFSAESHQEGSMPSHLLNKIPKSVIMDFLGRRQKNFQLNQFFMEWAKDNTLDFLIYCQDDTGPYGFNVKEADFFKEAIKTNKLSGKAHVQTGADEVALTLLARALWTQEAKPLKVFTWFFPDHGKKIMAKFDGMPLGNVVQRQIQTVGGITCLSPEDADVIFMVNAPSDKMEDHCAHGIALRPKAQVQQLIDTLREWLPRKNVALADVVYANGADPVTIQSCLRANLPLDRLGGYAGWNTPGNSIGTALAMGAVTAWANRHECLNDDARRRLLLTRFLDDWYYQSEVRQRLKKKSPKLPSLEILQQEMNEGANMLKTALNLPQTSPRFSFPCHRFFEIGVSL